MRRRDKRQAALPTPSPRILGEDALRHSALRWGRSAERTVPVRRDGVHVLPVLHERLEFADCVRAAMRELAPTRSRWRSLRVSERSGCARSTGCRRSRSCSTRTPRTRRSTSRSNRPTRWSRRRARPAKRGIAVRCADLDVDGYADYRDPVPDPYALRASGAAGRVRACFADRPRPATRTTHGARPRWPSTRGDCSPEGAERVLLVCGMHHAEGVARALDDEQAIPLTRPSARTSGWSTSTPTRWARCSRRSRSTSRPTRATARARARSRATARARVESSGRTYGPFRVLSGRAAIATPGPSTPSVARLGRPSTSMAGTGVRDLSTASAPVRTARFGRAGTGRGRPGRAGEGLAAAQSGTLRPQPRAGRRCARPRPVRPARRRARMRLGQLRLGASSPRDVLSRTGLCGDRPAHGPHPRRRDVRRHAPAAHPSPDPPTEATRLAVVARKTAPRRTLARRVAGGLRRRQGSAPIRPRI